MLPRIIMSIWFSYFLSPPPLHLPSFHGAALEQFRIIVQCCDGINYFVDTLSLASLQMKIDKITLCLSGNQILVSLIMINVNL